MCRAPISQAENLSPGTPATYRDEDHGGLAGQVPRDRAAEVRTASRIVKEHLLALGKPVRVACGGRGTERMRVRELTIRKIGGAILQHAYY